MSIEMQREFDLNFKEIIVELIEQRKSKGMKSDGEPFFTSDYPDAKKAFLEGFIEGDLLIREDDIEIQEGDLSLDGDAVPYIKFNIKVKSLDVCVSLIAYHHSSWDFYLNV